MGKARAARGAVRRPNRKPARRDSPRRDADDARGPEHRHSSRSPRSVQGVIPSCYAPFPRLRTLGTRRASHTTATLGIFPGGVRCGHGITVSGTVSVDVRAACLIAWRRRGAPTHHRRTSIAGCPRGDRWTKYRPCRHRQTRRHTARPASRRGPCLRPDGAAERRAPLG